MLAPTLRVVTSLAVWRLYPILLDSVPVDHVLQFDLRLLPRWELRMMGVVDDGVVEDGPADDRFAKNGQGIRDNGNWGQWVLQTMGIAYDGVADDRAVDDRAMDDGSADDGAAQ